MEDLNISVILALRECTEGELISCLSSISLNQACSYEILLTDTGERKETLPLLQRVAPYYPGTRVLSSPEKSLSRARNFAAGEARGQYVLYVNKEDHLLPETLDKAWKVLAGSGIELLLGQIQTGAGERRKLEGDTVLQILPESILPIGPSAGIPVERLRLYFLTQNDPLFTSGKAVVDRGIHARFIERSLLLNCPLREDLALGEEIIWNFQILGMTSITRLALWPFAEGREISLPVFEGLWASFPVELDRLLTLYRREIAGWPARDRVYYYNAAVEYFPLLCETYIFAQEDGQEKERFLTEVQSAFWTRIFKRADEKQLPAALRVIAGLAKTRMEQPLYLLCRKRYGRKKK